MPDELKEHLANFRTWLQDADFTLDSKSKGEVWNGSVFIEWEDPDTGSDHIAEHRLSIVLPAEFPYRAPIVISRDDPPLAPSWHLSPEPIHSLCLLDSQTGWRPHFTAHWLLTRILDWFRYYHTNTWPRNSEVPDLYRYLEDMGVVALGDEWEPPVNKRNGRFTLWQHRNLSKTLPSIVSCNEDQVSAQIPEPRLAKNLLFVVENSIKLPGVWFRLVKPFVPPNNLRDLLCGIDANLGVESGWAKGACIQIFGHRVLGSGLPIALGYTDYQNEERWLFLWAQLPESGKKRQKVPWSVSEGLRQIKVKSFQTAPARKSDLLRRSKYLSKHLSSSKATIFGVGALGGSVAVLLAKAGVSEIRLIDGDILMPGNVMRHVCGLNWVGLKKTIAVERAIHVHNPDCLVFCYDATWVVDDLRSYLRECDVVVDTTANPNFSLYLNEVCIDCNQPVVFAAAYRRATIGRVIVRRDSDDPCLACYVDAKRFWHEDQYPIIPVDAEEGFVEDGCGVITEEAVALDVEAVANLTARVVIKIIRKQLGAENLAILVNEPLAEVTGTLAQEGLHWKSNKPLAVCSVCRRYVDLL